MKSADCCVDFETIKYNFCILIFLTGVCFSCQVLLYKYVFRIICKKSPTNLNNDIYVYVYTKPSVGFDNLSSYVAHNFKWLFFLFSYLNLNYRLKLCAGLKFSSIK